MGRKDMLVGRDSLRRLIYEWDFVHVQWEDLEWDGKVVRDFEYSTSDDDYYIDEPSVEIEETDGHIFPGEKDHTYLVNLEKSPKRTNYERYFADLGTFGEVLELCGIHECKGYPECNACPFWYWGRDFQVSPWDGCFGFPLWLEQDAVM